MKYSVLTTTAALLATTTLAAPTDYTPPGGWESIKYPKGTGENLDYYPPPPGGWESVNYPAGTGSSTKADIDGPKEDTDGPKEDAVPPIVTFPFIFTSTYEIIAIGAEVRNGTTSVPGPSDAIGYFNFGINSVEDTICYNITLINVSGTYQSLARTATHIHQAARGASGPPRLALPNPVGDDKRRVSVGCMTGPFTTGLMPDGVDTGTGFKISQIEENPAGFFADSHTDLFSLGVVRGQFV